MEFKSAYTAKEPDAKGYVDYTAEEHSVWQALFERQQQTLPGRACDEFMQGLELLNLKHNEIPQIPEINARLNELTQWGVEPVEALIPPRVFFELLAKRKFPVATFIRKREALNYVKEPDIFHEIFGHCPMLTNHVFANFMQQFGELVLTLDEKEWPMLQRTYWFTVEFGLIQTPKGLRAYGGGILSSIEETVYSVESNIPQRILFAGGMITMRMPYRIDRLQSTYFVIHSYQQLYDFIKSDIKGIVKQAHELGEYPPIFPVDNSPNVNIHVC